MPSQAGERESTHYAWWVLLLILAAGLWSVNLTRPVDLPNWHEFDYSSIARNFLREGNNILLPRIDWRGDGPGYTEMEFPIVPWIMAQLYRLFGIHEIVGRILSLVFMLSSLLVFRAIALKFLPERAALVAALFFTVCHITVIAATAILPEPLMLLFYLLAVYYFLDWYQTKSWTSYTFAILSFAAAILVKSPAAHLAIFFLIWALLHDGFAAFRRPALYVFAVLSFAPAILWYSHAASLWHQFHNSMGVSNEDHWLGFDILRRPKVIANLIGMDLVLVFGVGGVLVAAAAFLKDRLHSPVNRLALSWSMAVAIYLIVIIRTAGANWAAYYHIVAVAPVALLFASGVNGVQLEIHWRRTLLWITVPAILLVAILFEIGRLSSNHLPGFMQELAAAHSSLLALTVLAVLSAGVTVLSVAGEGTTTYSELTNSMKQNSSHSFAFCIVLGCFTFFIVSSQLLLGTWKEFGERTPQYRAAQSFAGRLSPNSLIVASGGSCTDPGGHHVASDAPTMFYWLDHKGFTTCQGQESIAELQSYEKRGARYFIADKDSLAQQPGFEAELRRSFPLLADSKAAMLFSLDSRKQ